MANRRFPSLLRSLPVLVALGLSTAVLAQMAPPPAGGATGATQLPSGIQIPGATPQAPRAGQPPAARTPAAAARPGSTQLPERLLDRVVAVVNDEAITQYELNDQKRSVLAQMQSQKVAPPPADVLERQLLERLITERALLQFAKETGIRVDDTQVERTILRIAQDNKMTPDEFRRVLEQEKIPYAKYREDIRREIVIQRLREREVDNKISVSDFEVDSYLATVASQAGGEVEYLLSHILVSVPDQASADAVEARRRKAEEALRQLQSGADFGQVAAATSDAQDALSGGSLGWRSAARLPTAFADTVRGMQKGAVSPVIRSPAGFHIIKLVDERSRNAPTVVEQTNAKHILIKVNETTSEAEAKARIDRVKDRLDAGAKFEDLARSTSEDASSVKGGDLGWISPGDTVPDFERALNALKVGQVSAPVRSPFGWHLILVVDRRTQDVTKERQRDQARLAIRQRKSDEAFQEFVRQTRDRSYVEIKSDERA
jgi:peptidyl-prolyl cis-trans isomerase SurA